MATKLPRRPQPNQFLNYRFPVLIIVFSNIGSRNDTTTFYKTETNVGVVCGCFTGTIEAFENAVGETHGNNKYAQEYRLAIQLAKLHILGGAQ